MASKSIRKNNNIELVKVVTYDIKKCAVTLVKGIGKKDNALRVYKEYVDAAKEIAAAKKVRKR